MTDEVIRLLSARQVCSVLSISDRCLRRWVSSGAFPPPDYRFGCNLRWRTGTIEAFLQEHESNGNGRHG